MNRSSMPKQVMTFSNGGLASFIPRQTMINRQPHSLAYINPQEAALLRDLGGSGNPGPGGIPAYDWSWAESSLNPKNWGGGGNSSSSNNSSSNSSSDNNSSSSAKTNQDRINEIYASSDDPWAEHGAELNDLVADRSGTYDSGNNSSASTSTPASSSNNNNDSGSNSISQTLANVFTPFDNQEYVDGVLVDKASNTLGQTLTNIFTPFDNQEYVGGNLVDYDNYGALLPPIPGNDLASSDADGDGIPDAQEFVTLYDAQSTAAANDPTGQSTGTGFIAGSDFSADIDGDGTPENYEAGTQYAVNTDGSVAVAGSAEDLTGGMSQLDSALVNQGLAEDYNNDGVISFDETFGADSTVSSGTGTDTTGGGDDDKPLIDVGEPMFSGDDEEEGPPSSLNFRFYGGYQPRTRADVLVASPGADEAFVMPDDPRITPIFAPNANIDQQLGYAPTPGLISGPRMGDTGSDFDFGAPANVGDTYFDPATNTTYEYTEKPLGSTGDTYQGWDIVSGTGGQVGLLGGQPQSFAAGVTPGPGMPGQGQFATMQELMEYQQKYPSANLMGEYQRLKALEGGAAQPAVLPQRGVASLMAGDPATEAMYQGIMS